MNKKHDGEVVAITEPGQQFKFIFVCKCGYTARTFEQEHIDNLRLNHLARHEHDM